MDHAETILFLIWVTESKHKLDKTGNYHCRQPLLHLTTSNPTVNLWHINWEQLSVNPQDKVDDNENKVLCFFSLKQS